MPQAIKDVYLTALKDNVAVESFQSCGNYIVWSRKSEAKPTYKAFWVELNESKGVVLDDRVGEFKWTTTEKIGMAVINPSALLHVEL